MKYIRTVYNIIMQARPNISHQYFAAFFSSKLEFCDVYFIHDFSFLVMLYDLHFFNF